jgi:hypothetical protein
MRHRECNGGTGAVRPLVDASRPVVDQTHVFAVYCGRRHGDSTPHQTIVDEASGG